MRDLAMRPSRLAVSDDRRRIVVSWHDGTETVAPAPWLFDNAEGGCDPRSGHRLSGGLALAGAEAIADAVRINHRSLRAPPLDVAEPWYDAYLDFYRRLHAPSSRLERKLAPGDVVIFDNRRILHGRSSYIGGDARWLQGCYAEVDGLRATLSRLGSTGGAGE